MPNNINEIKKFLIAFWNDAVWSKVISHYIIIVIGLIIGAIIYINNTPVVPPPVVRPPVVRPPVVPPPVVPPPVVPPPVVKPRPHAVQKTVVPRPCDDVCQAEEKLNKALKAVREELEK